MLLAKDKHSRADKKVNLLAILLVLRKRIFQNLVIATSLLWVVCQLKSKVYLRSDN